MDGNCVDERSCDHPQTDARGSADCFASSSGLGGSGTPDDEVLSRTLCPVWFLTTKGVHCCLSMLSRGLLTVADRASGQADQKTLKVLSRILREVVELILEQHNAFMTREVMSHAVIASSSPGGQTTKTAAILSHSYSVVKELGLSALSCLEEATKTEAIITRCVDLAASSLADLKRAVKVTRGAEYRVLLSVTDSCTDDQRAELNRRWCDHWQNLTVAQRGILVGWARDASTVSKLIPDAYGAYLPAGFHEMAMGDYSRYVFTTLIPLRNLRKAKAHKRQHSSARGFSRMERPGNPLPCNSIREYSSLEHASVQSTTTTSQCFLSGDIDTMRGQTSGGPVLLSTLGEGPSLSKRHSDTFPAEIPPLEETPKPGGDDDTATTTEEAAAMCRPCWITRSFKRLASIGRRNSST